MPVVTPARPFLNPYRCDICRAGIGLDGLVEVTSTRHGSGPAVSGIGRCLCAACLTAPAITPDPARPASRPSS